MPKAPLIVSLLLLLALQPAGLLHAQDADVSIAVASDQSAVLAAACERMNGIDCHEAGQCLVSGHVGCDLNPFQPAADSGHAPKEAAANRSAYDVLNLPLNETSPPLRPPRRS